MTGMRLITKPSLLMLALLLVAGGATAQPIVSASGHFLTVGGVTTENGAILTVAGPGGFKLMQNIAPGENATVDLMGVLQAQKGEAAALEPGTYYYELLSRPGGKRVSGTLRVGPSVPPVKEDSSPISGSSGPAIGLPVPTVLNESDRIQIADTVNDGITVLDMDSDGATNDLHWGMINKEGQLLFREHTTNISGDVGTVGVSFGRPTAGLGVGIGTEVSVYPLSVQGQNAVINLTDTDGGTNWKMINSSGDLIFQKDCETSCSPFERWNAVVIKDGTLANSLVIDSSGVAMLSSRTAKANIEPVASSNLLAELAELPLYTWSYADDSSNTVHVGPMAEDFHQRFGFGADEKLLSPMDTGGLALAAIQALRQEVLDKDAKLEALEQKLEDLQAVERRLEELERLMVNSL